MNSAGSDSHMLTSMVWSSVFSRVKIGIWEADIGVHKAGVHFTLLSAVTFTNWNRTKGIVGAGKIKLIKKKREEDDPDLGTTDRDNTQRWNHLCLCVYRLD